jgi:hypothetical protein
MLAAAAGSAQPIFVGPSFFHPNAAAEPGNAVVLPTIPAGTKKTETCLGICIDPGDGTCDGSDTLNVVTAFPGAPFTVKNFRRGNGTTSCATAQPVSFPVELSAGQVLWYDAEFAPPAPGRYVDSLVVDTDRFDLYGTATSTFPCTPNTTTACLGNGRFKVTATYQTAQQSGDGKAIVLTGDTTYFWFFSSANVEVVVKVLDACGLNNRFWVFASGLTDVGVVITVTDTSRPNTKKTYTNTKGKTFVTKTDTAAFATCP